MKFLVVGLGSMGKRRIRNLQALDAGEIVGLDLRADRRAEVEEKYGVVTVDSLDAGLAQQPDAMVISTPPDKHLPLALVAARRGLHFFTEAGTTDAGIEDVLAHAARTPGLVAMPSCTMRHFFGPRKIKELVESGAIGRPLSFVYQSGQWLPDWHPWEDYRTFYVARRETGACREIVPFELTWLTGIFGAVDSVHAFKGKLSELDADIDDIYQCTFGFASGVSGFLQVDVLARAAVRHFRLLGSEGTIEWSASDNRVRLYCAQRQEWTDYDLARGTVAGDYADWSVEEPYINEMREFLRAIRGEISLGYTYADDGRVLEALRAAEESHESGRRIGLCAERETIASREPLAWAAD